MAALCCYHTIRQLVAKCQKWWFAMSTFAITYAFLGAEVTGLTLAIEESGNQSLLRWWESIAVAMRLSCGNDTLSWQWDSVMWQWDSVVAMKFGCGHETQLWQWDSVVAMRFSCGHSNWITDYCLCKLVHANAYLLGGYIHGVLWSSILWTTPYRYTHVQVQTPWNTVMLDMHSCIKHLHDS